MNNQNYFLFYNYIYSVFRMVKENKSEKPIEKIKKENISEKPIEKIKKDKKDKKEKKKDESSDSEIEV